LENLANPNNLHSVSSDRDFHEGDNHPGSVDRWVNAKDMLSLSLLQARLIDLNMPIKIVQGT
jgi:hypothetical protein